MKSIFLCLMMSIGLYGAAINFAPACVAQPIDSAKAELYKPFDFKLQIKNMHLWRGFRVTDTPMTAADVHFTTKDGKFVAGVWGGTGFTGEYTEFDYYVKYTTGGLTLAVWDINNFSDFPDAKIFDYDRATTSHFVDISASYAFKSIPLNITWTVIVLGRDTFQEDDGAPLQNAYSNYVEASYVIWKQPGASLSAFVAGGGSFRGDDHFYGQEPNLVNVGLTYQKDVQVLKSFVLPMSAMAMWNPEQEYGAIQVAVNLF